MGTKISFAKDFAWPIGCTTFGAAGIGWGAMSDAYGLYTAGLPEWAFTLFGLGVFLIGFVVALYTVATRPPGVKVQEGEFNSSSSEQSNKEINSGVSSAAVTRTVFQNEEIKIWELVHARDAVIEGKTFVDCIIVGPALVTLLDSVHIDGLAMDGSIEANLVEIEGDRQVIGVFGLRDCRFQRVRFSGIGFIGPKPMLGLIRDAFR